MVIRSNLQDCIDISSFIENNLDREEHAIFIRSSLSRSFIAIKNKRQYKKNIGRTLKVKTQTETIEAELTAANDEFIVLSWRQESLKKLEKEKKQFKKEKKYLIQK
jgi:ribosome maturation factor RimP